MNFGPVHGCGRKPDRRIRKSKERTSQRATSGLGAFRPLCCMLPSKCIINSIRTCVHVIDWAIFWTDKKRWICKDKTIIGIWRMWGSLKWDQIKNHQLFFLQLLIVGNHQNKLISCYIIFMLRIQYYGL